MKNAILGLFLFLVGTAARADIIHATPAGFTFNNCGQCFSYLQRGIYFEANENFHVSQVGWVGMLSATMDYQVLISEGAGEINGPGDLLASYTQTLPASNPSDTNFVGTDFTFLAGNEYHISFGLADFDDFSTLFDSFSFSFDFMTWVDGANESDLGLFTILDGTADDVLGGGAGNTWLTHFVFDAVAVDVPEVSEPSMAALFLIALTMMVRRRKLH